MAGADVQAMPVVGDPGSVSRAEGLSLAAVAGARKVATGDDRELLARIHAGDGESFGGASMFGLLAGWSTAIPPVTVLRALAFSACIGVSFGLYPARKALRLSAIDALHW